MIGSIVDQRIFEGIYLSFPRKFSEKSYFTLITLLFSVELMNEHLPHITKHIDHCGLPLAMISLPWFLCLFIGYVPMEVRK